MVEGSGATTSGSPASPASSTSSRRHNSPNNPPSRLKLGKITNSSMLNTIELLSRAVETSPVGHRRHRRLQHKYRCQIRSNVLKKQDFFRSICYVEDINNLFCFVFLRALTFRRAFVPSTWKRKETSEKCFRKPEDIEKEDDSRVCSNISKIKETRSKMTC